MQHRAAPIVVLTVSQFVAFETLRQLAFAILPPELFNRAVLDFLASVRN